MTLLATRARAEETPTPIRVVFDAPADCPSLSEFTHEVTRRTPRVAISSARDATAWEVRIVEAEGRYVGRLRLLDGRAAEAHEQRSTRCSEVASALGLTLALSLDPDARTDLPPSPPTPAPTAAARAPVETRTTPTSTPSVAPVVAPDGATARSWHVGLSGQVTGFAMTNPWLGGNLSIETRAGRAELPYAVRARVIVAGEAGSSPEQTARTGIAALGFDVCVGRRIVSEIFAWPCAGVEPGIVSAEGQRISAPTTASALWVSVSGRLRLDAALGESLGLVLEGAAVVPLVRPRFYIDPTNTTAAEAGPAAAEGSFGLRYRFW